MLNNDEICPGLTFAQHAESLAMWEMHNVPTTDYKGYLVELSAAWYQDLTDDLAVLQPYSE